MSKPDLSGLPDGVISLLSESLAAAGRGDHFAATATAKRALRFAPGHPEILRLVGLSARAQGDWAGAARHLGEASRARPRDADLALAWADALAQAGDHAGAAAAYRAALSHLRDHAPVWINYIGQLLNTGFPAEAEALCDEALALHPDEPMLWANYGKSLMEQYKPRAAMAAMQTALRLDPSLAWLHSNILFCINYCADMTDDEVLAAYRAWDESFGRPFLPQPLRHENDASPARRLKIGYVSPDFRSHAVAMFIEPILAAHDRAAFEIHLYAAVSRPDATTARLRGLADHWHDISRLDFDAAAAMVRAHKVDILVDLAGHTAENRLPVFARKPAPVQVAYLIGQGTTTGLSAIDGFFADRHMAPPGSEKYFSEQVIRLDRSPLVYQPPAGMPDVGPLPAFRNGHITFGSCTRFIRINDQVVAAWAAILSAVPQSRLLLNNRPFNDPVAAAEFAARMEHHGVARERLRLLCTPSPETTWATYNAIDIALDPFPHNAGTTTIEALWMGVPVISKRDRPPIGRFGASILGALGLDAWVAGDVAEYVAIARERAADLPALAALRQQLRPRFAASELRDAPGLTRAMEAGYRQLWQDWCARQAAR